jgi:hypothetical protein
MPLLTRTATSTVPFPESLVYDILIDYNHWSEWFPGVSSSRLLTREGDLAVVELGWGPENSEAAILECIQTARRSVLLRWVGGFAPAREMEWRIASADPGFSAVTLRTQGAAGKTLRAPRYLRTSSPSRCLAALETALEAACPGPRPGQAGENLFELWETEKGLVCWVRGKKYNLVPADE